MTFPETIVQLVLNAVTTTTSNPLLLVLQIIIFFLLLSMFLYYGEEIWETATSHLPKTTNDAIGNLSEIANNTIYSLIIIQISAALYLLCACHPVLLLPRLWPRTPLRDDDRACHAHPPHRGTALPAHIHALHGLARRLQECRHRYAHGLSAPERVDRLLSPAGDDGEAGRRAPGLYDDRHFCRACRSWGLSGLSSAPFSWPLR